MPRPTIFDAPLTQAERSRRSRAKAREARQAGSAATTAATPPPPAPSAPAMGAALPRWLVDVGTGEPDAAAERIVAAVGVDRARAVTTALQTRLMAGGSWPLWAPPIIS